jgi:hypothetical protein
VRGSDPSAWYAIANSRHCTTQRKAQGILWPSALRMVAIEQSLACK